jgi:tetratricopeptide (TPR) repeat protein
MRSQSCYVFLLLFLASMLPPRIAWLQVPVGGPAIPLHGPLAVNPAILKMDWHIFGRVTTLNGEPVGEAKIRIDIGTGMNEVKRIETNLQGEFRTDYNLDAKLYPRLNVKILASKAGYQDAREMVDFGASDKTWEINVVLRDKTEDPDQLSQAALIRSLAPRRQNAVRGDRASEPGHKDYVRGAEEFFDRRDPAGAVPLLAKVVDRRPGCVECRTLLGLALLDAGSCAGATRQLSEAAKLSVTERPGSERAELLLILGVLEAWRREDKKAAGFYTEALSLDPENPLLLQELGRVLIFQKNWEAADHYLERAIKAGASEDARLLRVRALLEEGDAEEADAEMKRYLAGRDIKDFPVTARTVYAQLQTRLDLRAYGKVKSVVSEPLPQLIKALPELRGLEAAPSQEALTAILRSAGENVESFFRNFPNTVSSEEIRQERLGKDGKIKDSLDQKFHYLLLARPETWGLGLEEYRTDNRGGRTAPGGLSGGFMLTSGFASASLLFHPAYQSGASFRYLGRQSIEACQCYVVAFAQRPETAQTVERFNTDQASVFVLLQGVAWIDPENYRIIRMRTDLLKPQSSVRLQRQTTEIQYHQVQFKEIATGMWLPRKVAVTVDWKGKTFHNLHRYTDFKLFNIETKEKARPLEPAPPSTKPI